jgi:hypothetical protein
VDVVVDHAEFCTNAYTLVGPNWRLGRPAHLFLFRKVVAISLSSLATWRGVITIGASRPVTLVRVFVFDLARIRSLSRRPGR